MTDLERHPHDLTIAEAGAALRNGSLSCAALTESVLERLEQTEPLLNAYITVTADLARQQAAQLDDELRDGRDRGPLHGIPIGLKDLVDTAGIPTTGGSGFLRDRVPETDATVWTKLQQAGAVLPGKLNLHEFAFGTTSRNPHYGAVHNPWDTERSPGGSSGGSGAAVAVGSALAAIGSDTGGSIRIPASLCGVVGLMGTYGRVSRAGVLPLSWTLDHVGPLARTVEDAAMFLDAIAGYDPLDPGSADRAVDDTTAMLGEGVDGLRIGVPRKFLWTNCQEDVLAHCEEALDHLQRLGAELVEVELPLQTDRGRGPHHHRRSRRLPRQMAARAPRRIRRYPAARRGRPGRQRSRLHQRPAPTAPLHRRNGNSTANRRCAGLPHHLAHRAYDRRRRR